MASSVAAHPSQPLSDLNTTPLIDVLLVLLVMFILTIPVASHTLAIDLPSGKGVTVDAVQNEIGISAADTLTWNGNAVSERELVGLLAETARSAPEPVTLFRPDANASYAASARVMRLVKAAQVTHFAFAGNERYRSFGEGK